MRLFKTSGRVQDVQCRHSHYLFLILQTQAFQNQKVNTRRWYNLFQEDDFHDN